MVNEAKAVREIRKRCAISQIELALVLGYTSPQFISNCERGLCGLPLNVIGKIAKKYGRKYAKLLVVAKLRDFENELMNELNGGKDARTSISNRKI